MKLLSSIARILLILVISYACHPSGTSIGEEDALLANNIFIEWELVSNQISDKPQFRTSFLIKNNSDQIMGNSGWAIYFNQRTVNIIPESVTKSVKIKHLGGDFMQLVPKADFQLLPGMQIDLQVDYYGWLIKEDQAPAGIYIVFYNEDGEERSRHTLKNFSIRPFSRTEQVNRFTIDQTAVPTPEWQYEQNKKLTLLNKSDVPLIIPTPVSISRRQDNLILDESWRVHYEKNIEAEAIFLVERFRDFLGVALVSMESKSTGEKVINLSLDEINARPESYQLNIENGGITIKGSNTAGVFYGIQSLLALIPIENYNNNAGTIIIPECTVTDMPRFSYRGMHLDVARNFNRKEAVFKLIDIMAFYKLNKLHLHLTDDEGWRLEVESLPELTQIGAFRGHTLDESNNLQPAYGSGPEPDSVYSFGSGFYSREDFIHILTYAHNRHIEVIPEFDLPGHSRAAIKSMDARYRRFIDDGKKEQAEEFLLSDPDDKSEYTSAQDFHDNVICVCQESTYKFIETVIDDVVDMYRDAGVPLITIHIGGDEVPTGSWEKSPVCAAFMLDNDYITTPKELMDYFLMRTGEILKTRNLILSGWEEIALDRNKTGGYTVKKPQQNNKSRIYIWDNFTEGNQDIGYKVANAGYPVILCSVTNFYFELAYNKDPLEPGDYWGGFVDTYKPFEYIPFDVYKSIHTTPIGKSYDPESDFKDMVKLAPNARENILGIQGELWSEPIKGPEMLEYFYLPKMLGLVEKAWAKQPLWEITEDHNKRNDGLTKDWNVFANAIGQYEMPRLDYLFGGYNYRLPPPGAKLVEGTLYANIQFPGLTIRYTNDGSEPTMNSTIYTSPVKVNRPITLRTFSSAGRGSRTVLVQ